MRKALAPSMALEALAFERAVRREGEESHSDEDDLSSWDGEEDEVVVGFGSGRIRIRRVDLAPEEGVAVDCKGVGEEAARRGGAAEGFSRAILRAVSLAWRNMRIGIPIARDVPMSFLLDVRLVL